MAIIWKRKRISAKRSSDARPYDRLCKEKKRRFDRSSRPGISHRTNCLFLFWGDRNFPSLSFLFLISSLGSCLRSEIGNEISRQLQDEINEKRKWRKIHLSFLFLFNHSWCPAEADHFVMTSRLYDWKKLEDKWCPYDWSDLSFFYY